jgi:hypothetical protein
MFAYRALASDVEAVAGEIETAVKASGEPGTKKVVFGTAADVAAFTQWRTIMGEILLLDDRATKIAADFKEASKDYTDLQPLLPAVLTVTEGHQAPLKDAKSAKFTITVANDKKDSGPTNAQVQVTAILPPDWKGQASGDGWACTTPGGTTPGGTGAGGAGTGGTGTGGVSCTRSDTLLPGVAYPPIELNISSSQPLVLTEVLTITVTGGGAPTRTIKDTLQQAKLSIKPTYSEVQDKDGNKTVTLTARVTNADIQEAGSTTAAVSVKDTLPRDWTARFTGDGWDCQPSTTTCRRSDPLLPGTNYPDVVISGLPDTPTFLDNFIMVAGGGGKVPAALSIDMSRTGSLAAGASVTYTLKVTNDRN